MSKRKRTDTSLEFKMKLICEVDSGRFTKTEICRMHDVPNSTLSTILKNRAKIEETFKSASFTPGRKRLRKGTHEGMENALMAWFTEARTIGARVSGQVLLEKANSFAMDMGIDFSPKAGWLERFKQRKGIALRPPRLKVKGDSTDNSSEKTVNWISTVLQPLLTQYEPWNIFSADETGLFHQCLPHRTLSATAQDSESGKKGKNHICILVAANMDGSEKLPLLAIGKSAKPRSFNSTKQLPVEYLSDSKAWMTSEIFELWVRTLDATMENKGRKILLIVDSSPSHPKLDGLKAINLMFLPPNTTSGLQYCDQGIVASLKVNYRKTVLRKLLLHTEAQMTTDKEDGEPFSISVLDALFFLRAAWNNVTQLTISNSFRYAGFTASADAVARANTINNADSSEGAAEYENLFEQLQDLVDLSPTTANDYLHIDDDILTTETITDQESSDSPQACGEMEIKCECDSDDETATDMRTELRKIIDARNAVAIIKKFIQNQEDGQKMYDTLEKLEEYMDISALTGMGQQKISQFLACGST